MDEKELIALCESERKFSRRPHSPYWTSEIYGFGRYIREYGFYPKVLPLLIMTDHGPAQQDFPLKMEIKSDASVQFYHSPRLVKEWERISRKPCYVIYSPFVYYRKKYNINRSANARGTLAYLAHTTPVVDDKSDIEVYIKQLLSLPDIFQPVSLCLHFHDINKGRHKIIQQYNIAIYTAGHVDDYRFPERFYKIIRNFRYTTSNMVMSCLFYSVEMGIPHFLYGPRPIFNNRGDPNFTLGKIDFINELQQMKKIDKIFRGLFTEITPEQKEIVEIELGLKNGIGRLKMARILYTSLLKKFAEKFFKI